MTAQLELFPTGVDLNPTPAMRAGEARVVQCSWCGLLVCTVREVQLGPCPACKGWREWWGQTLPVGPFVEKGHRDLKGAAKRTPSAAPPDEG